MTRTHTTKGISLAKGPIGLIGLAFVAYGISALIFGGHSFAQHAPNGAVHGKTWLGLEVNGWSGLLFIAAGVLLLLGAPLHWAAKGFSLIVGLALGAAALIALANSHGAVGLFAANHLTELVWGAAAVLLIGLSLLPRVGGKTKQEPHVIGKAKHREDYSDRVRAEGEPARVRADGEPRATEPEPARARTARAERQSTPTNGSDPAVPVNGSDAAVPVNGAGSHNRVTTAAAGPTLDPSQRSTATQTKEDQHV